MSIFAIGDDYESYNVTPPLTNAIHYDQFETGAVGVVSSAAIEARLYFSAQTAAWVHFRFFESSLATSVDKVLFALSMVDSFEEPLRVYRQLISSIHYLVFMAGDDNIYGYVELGRVAIPINTVNLRFDVFFSTTGGSKGLKVFINEMLVIDKAGGFSVPLTTFNGLILAGPSMSHSNVVKWNTVIVSSTPCFRYNIITTNPTAAGTYSQWNGTYSIWERTNFRDNAVWVDSNNKKFSAPYSSVSVPANRDIKTVQVNSLVSMSSVAYSPNVFMRSGGIDLFLGGMNVQINDGQSSDKIILHTDPLTGLPWTTSVLNAIEWGMITA
jgi:hypothetical protein